jgi:hypothetical protein
MNKTISQKIIATYNQKIATNRDNVGLSFYAFFANKNDNPDLLMQVAEWWIMKHQLDYFEKAIKIKEMIIAEMD